MARFMNPRTGLWEDVSTDDDADAGMLYTKRMGIGATATVPTGPANPVDAPYEVIGNVEQDPSTVLPHEKPLLAAKLQRAVDERQVQAGGSVTGAAVEPAPAPVIDPTTGLAHGQSRTTTNTTTTTSKVIQSEDEKRNLEKIAENVEAQKDARAKIADARIEQSRVVAAEQDEQQKLLAESEAKKREQVETFKTQYAERESAYNKRYEEMRAAMADAQKSPWQDKTSSEKVSAGIAMAIGAIGAALQNYGAGLQGRAGNAENLAFKVIMDGIEREAAQRRQRVMDSKELLSEAEHGMERARVSRDDALSMVDLDKAARLETAKAKLIAAQTRAGIPIEEAEKNSTVLKLDQEALATRQNVFEGLRSRVQTNTERQTQTFSGGMSPNGRPSTTIGDPNGAPIFGADGKPVAGIPQRYPGAQGAAHAVKEAEKINTATANYREIRTLMEELNKHYRDNGTVRGTMKVGSITIPASEKGSEREGMMSRLITLMKEQQKLGALAGPDMGIMVEQLSTKPELFFATGDKKLEQAVKLLDRSHQNLLDSSGLPGAQLLPAIRGDRQAARPATSAPTSAPESTRENVAAAAAWLRANPNADPEKRKRIQAWMTSAMGN